MGSEHFGEDQNFIAEAGFGVSQFPDIRPGVAAELRNNTPEGKFLNLMAEIK